MQFLKKSLFPTFIFLIFSFIYLPIIVLIIFSCNKIAFPYRWVGFSLQWYRELFNSTEIWHAVKNSFIVAISSVTLTLTMGVSSYFIVLVALLSVPFPFFMVI